MEKRDPLREIVNSPENNEHLDTDKDTKMAIASPDKENHPLPELTVTDKSPSEISGCGKVRLSVLKAFDPLYSESPQTAKVVEKTQHKVRPQLVIEDSDSETFVDAAYNVPSDEEGASQKPATDYILEQSLLKFTPQISNIPSSTSPSSESVDRDNLPTSDNKDSTEEKPKDSAEVLCETIKVNKEDTTTSVSIHGDSTGSDVSDIKTDTPEKSDESCEEQIKEHKEDIKPKEGITEDSVQITPDVSEETVEHSGPEEFKLLATEVSESESLSEKEPASETDEGVIDESFVCEKVVRSNDTKEKIEEPAKSFEEQTRDITGEYNKLNEIKANIEKKIEEVSTEETEVRIKQKPEESEVDTKEATDEPKVDAEEKFENLELTDLSLEDSKDIEYKPVEKSNSFVKTLKEASESESSEKETEEKTPVSESPTGESDSAERQDVAEGVPQEEGQPDSGVESIDDSDARSPKRVKSDQDDTGNLADDEAIEEEEERVNLKEHPVSEEESPTSSEESQESEISNVTEKKESSLQQEALKLEHISEEDSLKTDSSLLRLDPAAFNKKMADLSEKLSEQQQENSELKLQLNASQQAKATLELEIRQKEEIIIKTQAEGLKNEQKYKLEIKELKERLKENSKLIENNSTKELEEQLKEAKAREAKAITELNQRTKDDLNYQKIMEEYENTIATRFADYQKLKEEHETATRHLANIELAFSDVHQKYERAKALLEGFKANEEALSVSLQASEKVCKQHEERYESLKAHAKAQIEKSNKEILTLRDKYENDINKLKAIIKRLEIKCSSLEVSLQQKTEECAALSALCDEVTGKKL